MGFSDTIQSDYFETKELTKFKTIKIDETRRIAKIGFRIKNGHII